MTQGREAFLSTLNPQLYTIPATSPATAGGVLFPRGFFWAVFGLLGCGCAPLVLVLSFTFLLRTKG